jgi:hypothetical protein
MQINSVGESIKDIKIFISNKLIFLVGQCEGADNRIMIG